MLVIIVCCVTAHHIAVVVSLLLCLTGELNLIMSLVPLGFQAAMGTTVWKDYGKGRSEQLGKVMGNSQNQNLQRLMPVKAKIPTLSEGLKHDSES